jgi:hypothetical protein
MYDVKFHLSLTQTRCPICFRPLPFEGLTRVGDGHHVLVRRGAFPDDLLWVTENIVLVHHSCHMREGQATIHECAMLLQRFGGPPHINLWHNSLPWKSGRPDSFPGAWYTAARYFGHQSTERCSACGSYEMHNVTTGQPARAGERSVCWRCFAPGLI